MAALRASGSAIPVAVRLLLIANGVMFALELVTGGNLILALALWPLHGSAFPALDFSQSRFQIYQLVSYSFLHANGIHLLVNMYALWLFGSRMENLWGPRKFTIYYFVCVLGAALSQLLVTTASGAYYPTVGASGGVFGLLLAFGMRFPDEVLILIIPPVPIKAKWFVILYASIELWAGVTGSAAGVAHFAHLGGMLFGFILLVYWRRRGRG